MITLFNLAAIACMLGCGAVFITIAAMWLVALNQERHANMHRRHMDGKLAELDRWCADDPKVVQVVEYLRAVNRGYLVSVEKLRDRIRALDKPIYVPKSMVGRRLMEGQS